MPTSQIDGHLGQHLYIELSERQLDDQFAAIERRLHRRVHYRRLGWIAAASAVLLLSVVYLPGRDRSTASLTHFLANAAAEPVDTLGAHLEIPTSIEIQRDTRQRVVLSDHSVLKLEPGALFDTCRASGTDICLELVDGSIEFDVADDPQREFLVQAGDAQVRVIGTSFTVTRNADVHVSVVVHEGTVSIEWPDGNIQLSRGQTWSWNREASASVIALGPSSDGNEDGVEEPVVRTLPSSPRTSPKPDGGKKTKPSANDLWNASVQARREGPASKEAEAYAAFLDAYPNDARSARAAFELGLLLKEFNDIKGAIAAFERVAKLGGVNHEKALWHLVELCGRRGSASRKQCKPACERYLQAYPEGNYRQAIKPICDG